MCSLLLTEYWRVGYMIYCLAGLVMLIADVLSKAVVLRNLRPVGSIIIIKNILNFTYVENRGIAFGMFSGKTTMFAVISIVVVIIVLLLLYKMPQSKKSRFLKLGVAFVVSGALGNMADRLIRGYVVDFIDVEFLNFPVFNIADIAVCVGAALILIHFVFCDEETGKLYSKEKENE